MRRRVKLVFCALLLAFACIRCGDGLRRCRGVMPDICLRCYSRFLNAEHPFVFAGEGTAIDRGALNAAADLWIERGLP